jgi:hypothetical protein
MSSHFKRAALALAFLAALTACTSPSQSHNLTPPVGRNVLDETPPPCGPTCDSGGGLPGHG